MTTAPPVHGGTDAGPPAQDRNHAAPPVHGGTDAGPSARHDFSTNANALGPDPHMLAVLRAVDPTGYPDPTYTRVREALARWHGRDLDEVVVGAGACELIHRAVRAAAGPVVVLEPTFGEYRYAAEVAGLPVRATTDSEQFERALPGAALAILCDPNSPDGRNDDIARLAAAADAADCRLLLDLAYRPLSQHRPPLPAGAWQLWAPNKAHGVTGIRAGYLLAPRTDGAALSHAPSWVLSAHGTAFLEALPNAAAQQWVVDTRATLWRWRDRLVARLDDLDIAVTASTANFLLAHVGDATVKTASLRDAGIRVRDATSFGLPDALRLSAQPPQAQDALLTALATARRTACSPRATQPETTSA